jgi:hypothetical protein
MAKLKLMEMLIRVMYNHCEESASYFCVCVCVMSEVPALKAVHVVLRVTKSKFEFNAEQYLKKKSQKNLIHFSYSHHMKLSRSRSLLFFPLE